MQIFLSIKYLDFQWNVLLIYTLEIPESAELLFLSSYNMKTLHLSIIKLLKKYIDNIVSPFDSLYLSLCFSISS